MKKYLSIILLAVISFFFFDTSIFALSHTGSFVMTDRLDYGYSPLGTDFKGNYFNLMYEKTNNTSFYNYLISNSLPDIETSNFVSIFDIDEICYLETKYSNKYNSNICGKKVSYSDLKYVVVYSLSDRGNAYIFDNDNILSFNYKDSTDSNHLMGFRVFYFSSKSELYGSEYLTTASYITSYNFSYQWYQKSWYKFWESDSYVGSDFSLFLSKIFYIKDSSSLRFLHSTFDTYSDSVLSLHGAILNNRIFETDYAIDSGLSYFNKNPLVSSSIKLKSFSELLAYESTFISYDPTIIDLINYKGVLFVPKKVESAQKSDYLLYFKSSVAGSKVTFHASSDFDNFSSWTRSDFSVSSNLASLDMNIDYNKLSSSSNVYAVYLEPYNYFNSIDVYYNSAMYDLYTFSDVNSSIVYNDKTYLYNDFINDLNNYYINWESDNTHGGSCTIFEYFDVSTEKCVPIGTRGEIGVIEKDNSITSLGEAFNLTDFISSAWDGAKTFIAASLKISSLATVLFSTLPNEIISILLCGFTVCIVIICWKVFRS